MGTEPEKTKETPQLLDYGYMLEGPNGLEVSDNIKVKDVEHAVKYAMKKAKALSNVVEGEWKVKGIYFDKYVKG